MPGDAGLSLAATVTVGRKYTIYLPKSVVRLLGIKEGERLILRVRGDSIILRRAPDFFEASLQAPKRVKLEPGEVEGASAELQRELLGGDGS